ncbi:hypothetical protein SKAU_G00232820 [Synaphobranchus kaupii]|uniref:Sulfotransferase n=1 Tax=Synaphobranchus kaupii TaxID=118154 RepID=A0A9Q1ITJ1_SYNKA|nr:hypothetical protein SKAU_G00232820 [Synaphobranchus kaupii]
MWQSLYPGDAVSLQGAVRDMMNSLFRCDFSVLKLYAGTSNISTSFIFGWKTNKVICSEPLCNAYKKDEIGLVRGDVCDKCRPRDIKELERECKKYRVVVIKDVRVLDLSVLVPLIRDPGLNIRIIQLFRDPRAVHNSRLKSKLALVKESVQVLRSKKQTDKFKRLLMPSNRSNRAENYVSSAMELICDGWLNDMLLVANAPQWLKRNYMKLRYEDLVLYPVDELRRLYRFSNLTSFPKIEKFVVNMTRGEGYSSEKPFVISSRDAKEAIFAWRESLQKLRIEEPDEQKTRGEVYTEQKKSLHHWGPEVIYEGGLYRPTLHALIGARLTLPGRRRLCTSDCLWLNLILAPVMFTQNSQVVGQNLTQSSMVLKHPDSWGTSQPKEPPHPCEIPQCPMRIHLTPPSCDLYVFDI